MNGNNTGNAGMGPNLGPNMGPNMGNTGTFTQMPIQPPIQQVFGPQMQPHGQYGTQPHGPQQNQFYGQPVFAPHGPGVGIGGPHGFSFSPQQNQKIFGPGSSSEDHKIPSGEPTSKRAKVIITIVILLIVVAVIIVAACLLLRNKKEKTKEFKEKAEDLLISGKEKAEELLQDVGTAIKEEKFWKKPTVVVSGVISIIIIVTLSLYFWISK